MNLSESEWKWNGRREDPSLSLSLSHSSALFCVGEFGGVGESFPERECDGGGGSYSYIIGD